MSEVSLQSISGATSSSMNESGIDESSSSGQTSCMASSGEDSDVSMEGEGVMGGEQAGKRPAQVDLDRYRFGDRGGQGATTAGGAKAGRRSSGMRSSLSRGTGARASTASEVETKEVETKEVRTSTGSLSKSSSPKDEQGLSKEDLERRRANIAAMMSGTNLNTERNSLMPSLLTVDKDTTTLKKPFRSPFPNATGVSDGLMRALLARKQFVPFGGKGGTTFRMPEVRVCEALMKPTAPYVEPELPPGVEELVLWKSADESSQVRVDNMLTKFLRPHQREGVQFLFECVNGLREHDGCGAILADDMGLGKTLQGITLLWTLLNNGHPELGQEDGGKIAKRIVICCPTSLVSNWDSECTKWLQGRVNTMPIVDASRDEVIDSLTRFCSRANPESVSWA